MSALPFQPDPSRLRQRKPTLDIAHSPRMQSRPLPRKIYYPSRATSRTDTRRRGVDGVRRERAPLAMALKRDWRTLDLSVLTLRAYRKAQLYSRFAIRRASRLMPDIAPRKMLYGSLVGGIAFGMVCMGFIEHVFGPGVFARSTAEQPALVQSPVAPSQLSGNQPVASVPDENGQPYDISNDALFQYFSQQAEGEYEDSVRQMVKGYPIEDMLPYIFQQDRVVAAFLIGIGKKESNWGKRVPVLEGQDCFNYWGYRGQRRLMGTGGHTCFNSRKDAVETVAKRLDTLINGQKLNTPDKLVVWKCGFSCAGQDRESVKKWISDVDMYYEQLKDE